MRRNRTFAYDLIVHYGAVNSRVVLLLRSIEAKPKMSPPSLILPLAPRCFGGNREVDPVGIRGVDTKCVDFGK